MADFCFWIVTDAAIPSKSKVVIFGPTLISVKEWKEMVRPDKVGIFTTPAGQVLAHVPRTSSNNT